MKEREHISSSSAFFLILVAFCLDGIQAILTFLYIGIVVNPILNVFFSMIFFLWMQHIGIKRYLGLTMTGVAEFVPVLNVLPVWTGYMIYVVGTSKLSEFLAERS